MKSNLTKIVLAIGAVALSGSALAVDTGTASAVATATLITPLTVTKTTDLVFGTFAVPSSGTATSIIATDGGQTGTADFVGTQTTSAAVFAVAGGTTLAYTPTVTWTTAGTTGVTFSDVTGACDAVTSASVSTGGSLASCTTALGASSIKIGGTVTVQTSAAAGTAVSVGTLSVTVAYN